MENWEEISFNEPLVEKYRPKVLDDIIGNSNEILFLKKFIENNKVPNIILTGEPGGGKTSAVIAFAKEYLGEYFKDYCIELNASDDRGIDTVRTKIKFFAQKKKIMDKKKIVILDESDNMTSSAQIALRNTMDVYEDEVCFLFTCNNIENIIDAIQSRSKIMFFGRIEMDVIIKKILEICSKEGINIKKDSLEILINLTENKTDMRSILNLLELVKANFPNNQEIKKEDIYYICDKPSPLILTEVLNNIINKDIKKAILEVNQLKLDGFLNTDICTTFINEILNKDFIKDDKIKEQFLIIITKYNNYFLEGFESKLQLGAMIVELGECKI